jgi:hypothetical protein
VIKVDDGGIVLSNSNAEIVKSNAKTMDATTDVGLLMHTRRVPCSWTGASARRFRQWHCANYNVCDAG